MRGNSRLPQEQGSIASKSGARRRAKLAALLLVAFGPLGCNVSRNVWQLGLPGARTSFTVSKRVQRDGYLDVTVTGKAATLRSFVPADEDCGAVLTPEARVEYVEGGPHGGFERDGRECRAVGIGSLAEWRDRRPESQGLSRTPVPRAQASYRLVYEDQDVAFLRGRFPVASRLGWVGLDDSIAVVAKTPLCERPIRDSVASMEYYPGGGDVLALLSERGRCPIVGLLKPLP